MNEQPKRKNEEKAKNSEPLSRRARIGFVLSWMASTAIPLAGAVWLMTTGPGTEAFEFLRWIVMSILLAGGVATLQTFALKRILRFPAKGWFAATFFGWLITAAVPLVAWTAELMAPGSANRLYEHLNSFLLLLGIYWVIAPTLLQWFVLRKTIHKAYHWVTANVVSVGLFSVLGMLVVNLAVSGWARSLGGVALIALIVSAVVLGFFVPAFVLSKIIRPRGGKGQNQIQQFSEHDADDALDVAREELEEFDADEDDDLWEDDKPDRQPGRLVWQQA